MTTNVYAPTDMTGDPDWERVAHKFEQIFGVAPSPRHDVGKLLRDIRNVDREWADAVYTFITVFGQAPRGDADASQIYGWIDRAQVSAGDIAQPPVTTPTGTVIPDGGRLIIVEDPEGSDAERLYYVAYEWRGVELLYEIGDPDRYIELFGPKVESTFADVSVMSQARFDDQPQFVLAGSIDEKLNQTESEASVIERDLRAAGMEDIPAWIASNTDALLKLATATKEEWSQGRLWQELSTTGGFQSRYGKVLDRYTQGGALTIGEAVRQIEADEADLSTVLRPFLPTDDQFGTADEFTDYLQDLLLVGWTAPSVSQVLEQAETLRRDPDSLVLANTILERSGLEQLDEVGFINALAGVGPQDVMEVLNTATAARALDEAGIDLEDETINLVMELVDTSDRLLTAESWRTLAQQLSFQIIRFGTELDQDKLGVVEEDLIAAAFGRASPTGKTSGEVIDLLARFERDRRAASQGTPGMTGFLDERGRLRIAGLSGL